LHRRPCYFYEKIGAMLHLVDHMLNPYDPRFYTGFAQDIHDPYSSPSQPPFSLVLFVDNCEYFSKDMTAETFFEHLLTKRVKFDFLGLTDWFLGIHFSWHFTKLVVTAHLNQLGYSANLVEQFCHDSWDVIPTTTTYCSGVPIDSIAPSTDSDNSPA
jgi:hypothetical protein